jgi:hypothetical protein
MFDCSPALSRQVAFTLRRGLEFSGIIDSTRYPVQHLEVTPGNITEVDIWRNPGYL